MENPHASSVEEVAKALGSDPVSGLSQAEADVRLAKHGPNELDKEKKRPLILVFLKQFHNFLDYVLIAAAALSFFAGHPNDAWGIIIAILIDAIIGFAQERRAETAIEKLRDMVVQEATVVRDGQERRIPSRLLVPGDVLLIQEGDRVSADGRLVSGKELQANEASLTGESTPVEKHDEAVPAETGTADRRDMVWAGTSITAGAGRAIVVETGQRTAFGAIAKSLGTIKRERTPFETRVDALGGRLGAMSIILCAGVFIIGYGRGFPVFDMFLFAVAMIVSVIPEGLPAVLAIVLAIGVQRMAKRHAIIRHVPSVETLGFADIICTDKTGTLTENKMTVRELVTGGRTVGVTGEGWEAEGEFSVDGRRIIPTEERDVDLLLKAAAVCTKASLEKKGRTVTVVGDPTEGALVVAAAKAGLDKKHLASEYGIVDDVPFSSERKYRAVLAASKDGHGGPADVLFVVGAFEVLAGKSSSLVVDGDEEPFDGAAKERFEKENQRMAEQALRVLAVAFKSFPSGKRKIGDGDVEGLTFLGLAGMIDPPRAAVAPAIAKCRKAGVRVIMITGDQRATAVAVGREIGLLPREGGTEGKVFMERDVAGLSDGDFAKVLEDAAVFARVSPQIKLRIVTLLQAGGHTVAMTGDGVNDAPALKKASIGVAMGITGTDVSKEVADMVLADDNFVSIVNAIEEGRIVFRNVKQTTTYLFMTNVGEVITVLASLLLGMPLPILPAQILWMNLVTDGFPDVALATEGMHGRVLAEPPRRRNAPILSANVYILTALTAAIMCVGTLALFALALRSGTMAHARSVAFTTMAVFQIWNVFSMRSGTQSVFKIGIFSNMFVNLAVAASLLLQLAALYVPHLQKVFETQPLSGADWFRVVAVTSSVFVAVELYKILCRRGVIPKAWL